MKLRSGKALPILLGVLVVMAIVGAVIWVPKMVEKGKTDGVTNRLAVSSALLRAVKKFEDTQKKWPQSIEDLKNEAAVKALEPGSLNGVTYNFVRVNKSGSATYALTIEGKEKNVEIMPKRLEVEKPTAAAPQ